MPLDGRGREPSVGLTVSESTVSGGAQDAPHPALRPSSCAQAAQRQAQGLPGPMQDSWEGSHFTTSSRGPQRCRGQSCNAAVALPLWPSQVTGGHCPGEAVKPPPFLSFHMPSVPLLGLWPPSGTNHPPWLGYTLGRRLAFPGSSSL